MQDVCEDGGNYYRCEVECFNDFYFHDISPLLIGRLTAFVPPVGVERSERHAPEAHLRRAWANSEGLYSAKYSQRPAVEGPSADTTWSSENGWSLAYHDLSLGCIEQIIRRLIGAR